MQREIYQISLALERQTHNRADARQELPKNGHSDDKTAKQTHPRSFDTASSLEEEVTLTPLEGSFTTLPGDGVSCPPVTHALAVEFPSRKGESSAAAKARPSSAETQYDTNEDSFPQGSSNNTPTGRVDENKSKKGTRLHLFHFQPFVRDDNGGIFLNWTANELLVSQSDIQDHLDKTLREGLPTVLEAYQDPSPRERDTIRMQLELHFRPTLISLKRTYTDITHRDISFKHIPALQFVLMHETTGEPLDPPSFLTSTAIDSMKESELSRPTYIRCHRKHLSPQTVEAYHLPWQWEEAS